MGFAEFFFRKTSGLPDRGQLVTGITGTMAAGLASGACAWAFRYPLAATGKLYVERIHQHYVCLGGFTAPITAGRRLALFRGFGADPAGGASLDVVRKCSSEAVETLVSGKIATTAALTTTGITFESSPGRRLLLAHAGVAGASYDEEWRFDGAGADSEPLLPGELFGGLAGQAFDAGGTWQLNLSIDVAERM